MKKKIVYIKSKQLENFLLWILEKKILYGDIWLEWFSKKGQKLFFKYAFKKYGLKFYRIRKKIDWKNVWSKLYRWRNRKYGYCGKNFEFGNDKVDIEIKNKIQKIVEDELNK